MSKSGRPALSEQLQHPTHWTHGGWSATSAAGQSLGPPPGASQHGQAIQKHPGQPWRGMWVVGRGACARARQPGPHAGGHSGLRASFSFFSGSFLRALAKEAEGRALGAAAADSLVGHIHTPWPSSAGGAPRPVPGRVQGESRWGHLRLDAAAAQLSL